MKKIFQFVKKNKVVHIVLLQFKETTKEEQINEIFQDLEEIQKDRPGFLELNYGKDFSNRGKNFNYGFVSVFKNATELKEYDVCEKHEKLKEKIFPVIDDILAFDYDYKDGDI